MAFYIKANPLVVKFLQLENSRNKVKDGNYLLWQSDMLAFGRLTELSAIVEQIGALVLMAHEAREEQDGTVVRELPTATDPRFVVEKDEPVAEEPAEAEAAETPTETTEKPAENEEQIDGETAEPEQTENGETVETPNTETV